jgi:opacity protein-like surface antigen
MRARPLTKWHALRARTKLVVLVTFCLALPCSVTTRAHAQQRVVPEARIESARGLALGTGARSTSASTQANAENPANLVLGGVYHIETFAGYSPTFKRIGYGASIVDSMTSRLAAGISARGLYGDNDAGGNSGWEGRLSLGLPLGDKFSVGIAGRYANFTISDDNAKPERPLALGTTAVDQTFKLKAFTMDAAVTLRPTEGLAISALAYNIVDTKSPLAPLMVGGSAGFALGSGVTLGGDVLVDLNTHDAYKKVKLQVGGGVEYLAQGTVPVRLGYMYDQGRNRTASRAALATWTSALAPS